MMQMFKLFGTRFNLSWELGDEPIEISDDAKYVANIFYALGDPELAAKIIVAMSQGKFSGNIWVNKQLVLLKNNPEEISIGKLKFRLEPTENGFMLRIYNAIDSQLLAEIQVFGAFNIQPYGDGPFGLFPKG